MQTEDTVPNSLEVSPQISTPQVKSRNRYLAQHKHSEKASQASQIKGLYWSWSNLRGIVLWLGWTELLIH